MEGAVGSFRRGALSGSREGAAARRRTRREDGMGSFRKSTKGHERGTKKRMEPRMDADGRGWGVRAHDGDGAQRGEVFVLAGVGE